jgi:hypothetical protein
MTIRAKPTSRRLSEDDDVQIHRRRALGEAQHVLAAAFGVNPGRISEVLTGKLHPGARFLAFKS